MYVCMYVCMYVMYVMYVCMYVCMYVYIFIYIFIYYIHFLNQQTQRLGGTLFHPIPGVIPRRRLRGLRGRRGLRGSGALGEVEALPGPGVEITIIYWLMVLYFHIPN